MYELVELWADVRRYNSFDIAWIHSYTNLFLTEMYLWRICGIIFISQKIFHFFALLSDFIDFLEEKLFIFENLIIDAVFQ